MFKTPHLITALLVAWPLSATAEQAINTDSNTNNSPKGWHYSNKGVSFGVTSNESGDVGGQVYLPILRKEAKNAASTIGANLAFITGDYTSIGARASYQTKSVMGLGFINGGSVALSQVLVHTDSASNRLIANASVHFLQIVSVGADYDFESKKGQFAISILQPF